MSFISTDKYIKIPSVTTTQRNALTAVNGMVVYDTDLNLFYKYENGAWSSFAGGGSSAWGSITGTLSAQTDLQNALNAKEDTITAGTTSQYWRGDKSWQTLNKSAVGLGNVDNTSDANKPVSTAQAAADTLVLNTAKAYADKKRAYLYFSANATSPADSTTYYISFVSNVTANGTAGAGAGRSLQLGYAAKIVGGAVTVANTTTQGSSEDSTLLIRNVTTSTSSSIGTFKTNALVDGNNSFISKTITGASIYVAATDEIALQWNTPTYATNPAGTRIYGYLIVEF